MGMDAGTFHAYTVFFANVHTICVFIQVLLGMGGSLVGISHNLMHRPAGHDAMMP